jgi:hypothetical protein
MGDYGHFLAEALSFGRLGLQHIEVLFNVAPIIGDIEIRIGAADLCSGVRLRKLAGLRFGCRAAHLIISLCDHIRCMVRGVRACFARMSPVCTGLWILLPVSDKFAHDGG